MRPRICLICSVLFFQACHADREMPTYRESFLADDGKAAGFFQTHDYERVSMSFSGNPVHFLVVGGAGGGLEPEGEQSEFPQMDRVIKKQHFGILEVDSSRMHFEAYDLKGNIMDEMTIRK